MSGWDEGAIAYSEQNVGMADEAAQRNHLAQASFREFVRNYRSGASPVFIYREQLQHNVREGRYVLEVSLDDLRGFDEVPPLPSPFRSTQGLANDLEQRPASMIPLLEAGIKQAASQMALDLPEGDLEAAHFFQVTLTSGGNVSPIRHLTATHVSHLVVLSGIVIAASRPRAKATSIVVQCKTCESTKVLPASAGFGGAVIPRKCDRPRQPGDPDCGMDPFVIRPDRSLFVDQQTLKLQELPEDVPTGEMPRHMQLACDRYLVNRALPGQRVRVVGLYSVYHAKEGRRSENAAIRNPYVRVIGIQSDVEGAGRTSTMFTSEEEQLFRTMARRSTIYKELADSFAPSIFGFDDIKKAVVAQLFGGGRKRLPDGTRLRGDINVLLLGDPGTAKSQVLKFAQQVAPIGVYTSGKGSSAAGLTASVVKDPASGQFFLEGGAMVLADDGVVCIDEFDKMRPEDRVAIHEAMEQQTISVAKAGITTILNARSAVLAAANPKYGRYDDTQEMAAQIEFQTTILSRFDMIFLVRDPHDEHHDISVASHVIRVHQGLPVQTALVEADIDLPTLKRYIAFCRAKCSPRLSEAAAASLGSKYVNIRLQARQLSDAKKSSIPITVRQLEAIVRISESLAKLQLSSIVTEAHVEEAIRLFQVSTLQAAQSGIVAEGGDPSFTVRVNSAEQAIRRRMPIGATVSEARLVADYLKHNSDSNELIIRRAIDIMVRREELQKTRGGKSVVRRR